MSNTRTSPIFEYRRKLRPKVGQAEVARALGVTPEQYSRIESGHTSPSASQVQIIAKVLKLSVEEVIGTREIGTDSPLIQRGRSSPQGAGLSAGSPRGTCHRGRDFKDDRRGHPQLSHLPTHRDRWTSCPCRELRTLRASEQRNGAPPMSKDTYDAHHEAARRIFEQLVYLEQSEEADKGLQTQLLHEMFEHREAQRAADPERFERDQAAAISGFFRQSDDVEPATRH